MSRNLTFIILGLISGFLAYFFNPLMPSMIDSIVTVKLPGDYLRLLQKSDLISAAGYLSLFGVSFFLLYLIFPISYVWYHIQSAKSILTDLPKITHLTKRTDKKNFLSQLKGLGYIAKISDSYGPYLIQGAEQEINAADIKNARVIQKIANKNNKYVIAPVRTDVAAEKFFNEESLVKESLLLGFFSILSWVMVGIGFVCLVASLTSYSIKPAAEATLMSSILPGLTALLLCMVVAIIIATLTRMVSLSLGRNARAVARLVNGLFYQGDWPDGVGQSQLDDDKETSAEQLKQAFEISLDKPLKEISSAVKALSVEQEKKLDLILTKTLENFTHNLEKRSKTETVALAKSLKDVTTAADQMKKHFTDANTQYSKEMNKQTTSIFKHLTDMQKLVKDSEKTTQSGIQKAISQSVKEIEKSHQNLSNFIESSLKKLDDKQKSVEKTAQSKDTILKDLHSTTRDLGTISNASGKLLEKFTTLSSELDGVIIKVQDYAPVNKENGNLERRSKLKKAMVDLKNKNSNKTKELPDM